MPADPLLDLARHLAPATTTPDLSERLGVVVSAPGDGTAGLQLGGSTVTVTARSLSSYWPTIGDVVVVLQNGTDLLVLGAVNIGTIAGYPGEIKWGGWGSAPAGTVLCDGGSYNTTGLTGGTDASRLFTAIGYTYGGSGSTFRVPDLRGRSSLGAGVGSYSGATAHALGQAIGEETHTLTIGEAPVHTHTYPNTASAGGGPNLVEGAPNAGTGNNIIAQGGGGAHNTYHPVLALLAVIKL